MIEQDYYHKITDSAFITITGKDKFKYLQGLISNDLRKLDKIKCLYASMLSPHGRFLFDFFVSIFKEGYLIECKKCCIEGLLTKLKVYKLRSEVEVNILNNVNSYVINPSNKEVIKLYKSESLISFSESSMYIFTDGVTEIKDPNGEMLGAEGFQNYIKKYQSTPNNNRLKVIIEDIVKSGKIQKDDLTIVVIDGK